MHIHRIRTHEEYCAHAGRMKGMYLEREAFESHLVPKWRKIFKVSGYSWPAHRPVSFAVDASKRDRGPLNWRETLICPVTGLNNRMRATVQLFETIVGPYPDSSIYLTEQVTPFFRYLAGRYPHVTGSEYLGDSVARGALDDNGLRNEDLTRLSFADETFDFVLSLDCFEHVPDYSAAFAECFRVLAPGGTMFWSVPFDSQMKNNLIRARVRTDGEIEYLLPPEYHGDPMNNDGCLSYVCFGWEMIEQVRYVGFTDACALIYWSSAFGYLGKEQTLFMARKP